MLYSVRLETMSWAPKLIRKLFMEGAEQNSQAVFSQVAFSTATGHQQIAICWLLKRVQIKDTYELVVKAKSIFYTITGFELYSPLAAKSSMIHYSIKLLNPESPQSIISRNINITVPDGLKHNSSAWIWSFRVQGNVTDIIFPSLSVHCKISKQSIKCISTGVNSSGLWKTCARCKWDEVGSVFRCRWTHSMQGHGVLLPHGLLHDRVLRRGKKRLPRMGLFHRTD